MRKATLLVILLIIASLPSTTTADENPVRQRSNMTEFTWVGSATTVEVSGEWDDWQVRTDLVDNNGSWSVELSLNPGMYCYKLIIDNNWIFDPAEPYRGYCEDFENSIVRVPDTSIPMFTHEINNRNLTVYWHAGTSGGAPEYTPSALTNSSWDAQEWAWSLDLSNLPDGKNTLHIIGADVDGNIADDLLLPFWNGPQADFIWEDALIYMIMTDRFVNGNNSNDPLSTGAAQGADWMGGDFAGITQMIRSGHFTNLGVNALWLTPFNSAANGTGSSSDGQHEVSAYHGYWPVEPRGIDSRLGTEAELHELVAAAHDAGIRIMGDFVVNHVHEDHPYYSDNPDWFNQGCLCGAENCDWTEHRLDCLFSSYMPDVNWRERNASEQFISDVMWWMETFDLDGGRIDAVKHVEDLAITNLAVRINERFETAGTDYYLKGETAMGWAGHNLNDNANEYGTINNYIGPNALDGQADFVLYHAVVDNVFTSGNMDYAHLDYWTARSQDQYVEGAIMVPFVGSHDVPRFTSRADTGTSDAWNQWAEDGLPGQPGIDEPYQAALQAYTWLLTTPGSAMIYQGDEYGEFGGADPDNRHMWRNISNHNSRETSIMENISAIGQLRLNSDALRRGTYASLSNGTDTIAWSMTTESDQAVIAMNRGATSADFNLSMDWVANDSLNGIVMSDEHEFTLPPHSVAIFFPENEPGFNSLFMGHSFFRPFADEMPFHTAQAGIAGHSQSVIFSGGASGAPQALWENAGKRAQIQAILDGGDIELFGMTYHGAYPTSEGYENWIEYALAQNQDTRFFLALPWGTNPGDTSAETYASDWHTGHSTDWHDLIDTLRTLYPGVDIFCIPYGQSALELRLLFSSDNLPDVDSLVNGSGEAIYSDNFGHADDILKDLGRLVWLNAIYGVNLTTYAYDPGYITDLKGIAQSIMDDHDAAYPGPEPEPEPEPGCMDPNATNYDPLAEIDDGSCEYEEPPQEGCTDAEAINFDILAEVDDGTCEYEEPPQEGCTDAEAINFDIQAEIDDGTCEYSNPDPDNNSSNGTGNQTGNQTGEPPTEPPEEEEMVTCDACCGETVEVSISIGCDSIGPLDCEPCEQVEDESPVSDNPERTQGGFSFLTGAAIGFIMLIAFAFGAVVIITQSRRD